MTPGMDSKAALDGMVFRRVGARDGIRITAWNSRSTIRKGYQIRGKLHQTGVPHSFIARVPLYSGGAGHGSLLGTVIAPAGDIISLSNSKSPRKIVVTRK